MKKLLILTAAAGMSASLFAALYGDTPDARHAWGVHDWNRPAPKKITADPGKPPSDAIILFDGTEETFNNWCDNKGNPTKWKLVDGALESVRGAGYIRTKQSFGDCQLHVEWAAPKKVQGMNQGRGNSGVFLMGNYEIQVLDSYETNPDAKPKNPNPNYADGQASAVYAENPPMVNACRAPGEWQTYDIVFHQPIWENGKMIHPGSVTVFHNGVLTQDHWEMEGLTTHCRRRPLAPHATKLPLQFQDHGNPVRFRNIWIREIPSRYANTTHGGPNVKEADVMALRNKTAESLLANIDTSKSDAGTVNQILEVIAYSKDEKFMNELTKIGSAYLKKLNAMDDATLEKNKGAILSVKKSFDVLKRNKVIECCPLCKKVEEICKARGWDKKK